MGQQRKIVEELLCRVERLERLLAERAQLPLPYLKSPQETVENIQQIVAEIYSLKITDLTKLPTRGNSLKSWPRQVAISLCTEYVSGQDFIAQQFGRSDHKVVHLACKAVNKVRKGNKRYFLLHTCRTMILLRLGRPIYPRQQ